MPQPHNNINSIAKWSVFHPVGVIMIALAIVILGWFSLQRLGINLLPHIIYPEIRVRVLDPGVPASVMENKITRQLEEQLAITEDAISVQSRTSEGRSGVDLSFPYGKDIDIALRDASTRLDRAKRFLPDTIQPPIIYKRDPSQIPVLTLAVSAALLDPIALRTWVDKKLSKWFINLPGVAAAEVGGGLIREIQILPDQQRLVALGLSLENVISALKKANVETAGGRLYMPEQEVTTRLLGRWQRVEDIAKLRLSSAVFLGDVAQVIDTHQDERLRVRFNNLPSIKLSLQKQPQANTVEVVNTVLERLSWLKNSGIVPADVHLDVVDNQAIYVKQALTNAAFSALSGALLAMLVVYLFLGSFRHTLIIGTAIPLAITVTLILMTFGDLSLNIMTLGGLALGVGMVVDNTIVMLENITRHQQFSSSPTEGAINGAREITSAIVAATTTNLAAVLPFLFILGLVGLLFRELIFTISAAMLASLVVALTIVPALTGKHKNIEQSGLLQPLESLIKIIYLFLLKQLLKSPLLVIALFSIGLWFSIPSFFTGKQIFLPDLDEGRVNIRVTAEPGIALTEMDEIVIKLEKLLQTQPEVKSVFTQMGGFIFGRSQYEVSHRSSLNVQLVPLTQTRLWIKKMNKEVKKLGFIGVKVRMRSSGIRGIRLGSSDEEFSLRLQGDNLDKLVSLADELLERLSSVQGLINLKHSAEEVRQELALIIDRQRAQALGFTPADIGRDLKILMTGSVVTDFIENDESINVRLRLPPNELQNPQDLESVLLYNKKAKAFRLDELAQIQWNPVPAEIRREQQQRIIEISGDFSAGTTLAEVMAAVNARLANWELPDGYSLYEGGAAKALQENQTLTQILLALAIFLVFVVMAVQYESLRNPLVILFSVPYVIIGVALGIEWLKMPLSMPVWLGLIMLAGMVVNNAIVLVETIELQRLKSGISVKTAILEAAAQRLRPILMTTLTTVIGLLPLAMNWGEGAAMLQPLAITIAFGLSFSLLVSLLLVPSCYLWLAGAR
jgi:multidrug efflux pump subunit AcrB